LPLERITGEAISQVILKFLQDNNIEVSKMHGQGYDGASNMSSEAVAVQGRIKKEAPLATYVHCNGHCLNLVISKSCSLPQVRNVLDRMQSCCRFFLNSPKQSGLLEAIDWDTASRSDAQQLLASITSFEFIILFISICLI